MSVFSLAACGVSWAREEPQPLANGVEIAPKPPRWGQSFGGFGMSSRLTTALLPVNGDDYGDMNPIERPYGFGMSIDYRVSPAMRLFFDGNFSTFRKQVAVKDEYSTSFWVYEMTDYESHIVGPFTDDAYFFMDTTGMRLGVKYDFQKNGFRPWVGAGFGIYRWTVDYATVDRASSWGSDTGLASGATFLLGVDIFVGKSSMITLFGDFASPVANPLIHTAHRRPVPRGLDLGQCRRQPRHGAVSSRRLVRRAALSGEGAPPLPAAPPLSSPVAPSYFSYW